MEKKSKRKKEHFSNKERELKSKEEKLKFKEKKIEKQKTDLHIKMAKTVIKKSGSASKKLKFLDQKLEIRRLPITRKIVSLSNHLKKLRGQEINLNAKKTYLRSLINKLKADIEREKKKIEGLKERKAK